MRAIACARPPLGEHRRQNVSLLRVVSAANHIRAVDVFLDQQLFVGGIAMQHDGVFQQLGDPACPPRIALDEFSPGCAPRVSARRKPMLPPPAMTRRRAVVGWRNSPMTRRMSLRAARRIFIPSADRVTLGRTRGRRGRSRLPALPLGQVGRSSRRPDRQQPAALRPHPTSAPAVGEIQYLQRAGVNR